jgi:hypothetical protein
MLKCAAAVAVSIALTASAATQDRGPDRARELLDRAIGAAGGRDALARHPAFGWHGKATIYAGDRRIQIEGDWQLEPPDRSKVVTFEIDKGPGSARSMVIDRNRGWSVIGGKEQPLPEPILANERDQFYLYYLRRLEPLTRDGSTLKAISGGNDDPGLRISRQERPDVDMFFDKDSYLIDRMITRITDPSSGREVLEELKFMGTIESNGVRWFQGVVIIQDHKPFFALTLTSFTTLSNLDLSR